MRKYKKILLILCFMFIALTVRADEKSGYFMAGRALICMNVWDYFAKAAPQCKAKSACALLELRDVMWPSIGCDEVLAPSDIKRILEERERL